MEIPGCNLPPHGNNTQHLAPELGSIAKFFQQDCGNMPEEHIGLKTKQPPHGWFSAYQESITRNIQRNYETRLGLKKGE